MSTKTTGIRKAARKPMTRMTTAELARATEGVEDLDYADTKPLKPEMAVAWARAKRGPGRPRIGAGAERVLISMEKRLLLVTDALARRKGLDRSKLIAQAIREMLEREANASTEGSDVHQEKCCSEIGRASRRIRRPVPVASAPTDS